MGVKSLLVKIDENYDPETLAKRIIEMCEENNLIVETHFDGIENYLVKLNGIIYAPITIHGGILKQAISDQFDVIDLIYEDQLKGAEYIENKTKSS